MVHFDKFRALPINNEQLNTSQLKRHLKNKSIITTRDIETLNLVKKGSIVNVNLNNNNINISFSAKALHPGDPQPPQLAAGRISSTSPIIGFS